jgi:DNA-binding beta-propeller fold protein YncE
MVITHLALMGLSLSGCSAELGMSSKSDADEAYYDTGGFNGDDDDDDQDDYPPPEDEDDEALLAPAQTDVYVFIANPDRDTLTRVGVTSLDVTTVDVGRNPTDVRTDANYERAVVFNAGDDSVTIVDAQTLDTSEVGVRDNLNVMQMSPEPAGQWVVLWHDRDSEDDDDPPEDGLVSYNEASFVDTISGEHFPMAVGFNPRGVRFTPDASLAVIVSDAMLALVDLTKSTPSPQIITIDDSLTPPPAEEVALSPDGDYAFVRQFGSSQILVVDLLAMEVDSVEVGLNPTDMDITPDGTEAIIVSRDDEELWILDLADPFANPAVVDLPPGEALGALQLDPQGNQGIIYTTASLNPRYASWVRSDDEVKLRALVKPVSNVTITPTGGSMLVAHTKKNAPDADTSSPFFGEHALTMIDLSDHRANPLKLPAAVEGWANSTNGKYGYFIMKDELYLEVLHYDSLIYDQITLGSVPVHVGAFPDLTPDDDDEPAMWVSQEHELGRITFFDPDDESLKTITGFELNSQIEEN